MSEPQVQLMIDDGGNAFPGECSAASDPRRGMSLRDWFAGMAFSNVVTWTHDAEDGVEGELERLASVAYEMADAMLAERTKVKP